MRERSLPHQNSEGLLLVGGGVTYHPHRRLSGSLTNVPGEKQSYQRNNKILDIPEQNVSHEKSSSANSHFFERAFSQNSSLLNVPVISKQPKVYKDLEDNSNEKINASSDSSENVNMTRRASRISVFSSHSPRNVPPSSHLPFERFPQHRSKSFTTSSESRMSNRSRRNSLPNSSARLESDSESLNTRLVSQKLRQIEDKTLILTNLKNDIRINQKIPSTFNLTDFFKELNDLLSDPNPDIRNEATLLVSDIIPYVERDLDKNMKVILPKIVSNVAHQKYKVQESSLKLLKSYIPLSKDKPRIIDTLILNGIKTSNKREKAVILHHLPTLIDQHFEQLDLSNLVAVLSSDLASKSFKVSCVASLVKIKSISEEDTFEKYKRKLQSHDRRELEKNLLLEEDTDQPASHSELEDDNDVVVVTRREEKTSDRRGSRGWIEYGVIDQSILDKLKNEEDWRVRAAGCTELQALLLDLSNIEALLPHISDLLTLLETLRIDSCFQVVNASLNVIGTLIRILKEDLQDHLPALIWSLVKYVGDHRMVVRIQGMKIYHTLIEFSNPKTMIALLCEHLNHRKSRVREDSLNLITVALLTYPSSEFSLLTLVDRIPMCLLDGKRRVRQASLEAIATLAQFLGSSKMSMLLERLEKIEDDAGVGVLQSVQMRLSRRSLPRITVDGLLEYAVLPHARRTNNQQPEGSDIDWILAGHGGLSLGSVSGSGGGTHGVHRTLPSALLSLNNSMSSSSSAVSSLQRGASLGDRDTLSNSQRLVEGSLQRKRSFSEAALNFSPMPDDRSGITLWTSDTLDLSRGDNGNYRGVYLGRLAPGSAIRRSTSLDKGFSLLPNKYTGTVHHTSSIAAGEGRVSAMGVRGGRANGFTSPTMTSPTKHRKVTSLIPLDQGTMIPLSGSSHTVIPPLSAYRASKESTAVPHEKYEQHIENFAEEENASEGDYENASVSGESRVDSSSTTRDSGISLPSRHEEDMTSDSRPQTVRVDDKGRTVKAQGSRGSIYEEKQPTDGRNSYDYGDPRILGGHSSPSTQSLPITGSNFHRSKIPQRRRNPKGPRVGRPKTMSPEFKAIEYESDFESDDESHSTSKASGINIRKVKEQTMRDIHKRILTAKAEEDIYGYKQNYNYASKNVPRPESEERRERANRRETRLAKELRERKYRELQFTMNTTLNGGILNSISNGHAKPNDAPTTKTSNSLKPNAKTPTRLSPINSTSRGPSPRNSPRPSPRNSPTRSRRNSPIRSRRNSPIRSRRNSPIRSRRSSPVKSRRSSPVKNRRNSPDRNLKPSQISSRRNSPIRSRRNSPIRSRRNSPIRSRRSSPVLTRKNSPIRSRRQSPVRKSSPVRNARQTPAPKEKSFSSKKSHLPTVRKLSPELIRDATNYKSKSIPKSRSHEKVSEEPKVNPRRRHNSLERASRGGFGTMRFASRDSNRTGLGSSLSSGSAPVINLGEDPEIEKIVSRLETARVRQNKPMSTTFSRDITRPFNKPGAAVKEIKENLGSDDWEMQVEGIQGVSRLTLFHPDVLKSNLQEILVRILEHGRNLRSQVSRSAMQSLMHLLDTLQRQLEQDLEKIVNLLLNKTMETNKFLKEDANNALDAVVENTNPTKAMPILIQEGINHRNAVVKTALARLLAYYAERLGPAKALSRDIADRLLPAGVKLAQEGSLDTRKWAKILFQRLAPHPTFTDAMKRTCNPTDLSNTKKFLDNLYSESRVAVHDSAGRKSNVGGGRHMR